MPEGTGRRSTAVNIYLTSEREEGVGQTLFLVQCNLSCFVGCTSRSEWISGGWREGVVGRMGRKALP